MSTNHQMNYYDYAKTLSAEGNMTALIGGGSGTEPDTLDYVDLGLPSGTLWAKHNIQDANGNELYFAWGEIDGYTKEQVGDEEGKRAFADDDYEFGPADWSDEPNYGMTKYNSEGPTELEPEDDAATQIWGSDWRMPTRADFEELTANTEYEWTTVNGVQGAKFTSTVEGYEGNSVFFPAVGYAEDCYVYGDGYRGKYWSVSLDGENVGYAYSLQFEEDDYGFGEKTRTIGNTVRPVCNK